MTEMTRDLWPITLLDVSSAAEVDDGSRQPLHRVYALATSARSVDIDILYSEVGCGRGRTVRHRRRSEMTPDVLRLTTMNVSGGTKEGDWSPQPYDRAEMWAAAVRCVDIDVMCSEVG